MHQPRSKERAHTSPRRPAARGFLDPLPSESNEVAALPELANSLSPRPPPSQTSHRSSSTTRSRGPRAPSPPVSSWPSSNSHSHGSPFAGGQRARAKPCLLLEMEAYLTREASELKVEHGEDGIPPEAELAVYRECNLMFITHFKEYSGILSLIMRKYDSVIDKLRCQLHRAVEDQVVAPSQTESELNDELRKAWELNQALRKENGEKTRRAAYLEEKLQQQQMETMNIQQEGTLKEAEHKDEYQRNVLLSQALREQAERQHKIAADLKAMSAENEKNKSMAEWCNQQLNITIKQAETRHHEDDVQRIQILEQELVEVKEEADRWKARNHRLIAQNFQLASELKALKHKFDNYKKAVEEDRKRALTPRPQWRKVFTGWDIDWPSFEQRPTSEEMLGAVLKSQQGLKNTIEGMENVVAKAKVVTKYMEDEGVADITSLPKQTRFFIGKGTSDIVPKYLRWHGKVPARGMSKGEAERIIKDVWREKTSSKLGTQSHRSTPLAEYFYLYLLERERSHDKAIETAYNMMDTMERNQYDADIEMFLKILHKKVPEEVYHDQLKTMAEVKAMFVRLDTDNKGVVGRKACKNELLRLFPAKSHEDHLKLRYHLMMDQQGNTIEYKKLFEEDDDGNQGGFIECLRDQHLHEIQEYMVDVEQGLRAAADPQTFTIGLSTAKQVIQADDVEKPEAQINAYLVRGMNVRTVSKLNWDDEVAVDQLVTNMTKGLMKRTSKRPERLKQHQHQSQSQNQNEEEGEEGGKATPPTPRAAPKRGGRRR